MGSLGDSLRFDHVEMYVNSLQDIEFYKGLERQFNKFQRPTDVTTDAIVAARRVWEGIAAPAAAGDASAPSSTGPEVLDPATYTPVGQDPVEQLICGLGWRISQVHDNPQHSTRSVVLTTVNPEGAVFVVTARRPQATKNENENGGEQQQQEQPGPAKSKRPRVAVDDEPYPYLAAGNIERFYDAHAGRPGFAVLSFETQQPGGVAAIHTKYKELYPQQLLRDKVLTYGDAPNQTSVCEVFAYRTGDLSAPDRGTVLRFVERSGAHARNAQPPAPLLPGFEVVPAEFDGRGKLGACFSDHWVSNVIDRKDFLHMLNQTLGFTPKVDFNAGVVGAGEAVIESTVTGNQPASAANLSRDDVLVNQQQVYLPTNNALSDHGHVHLFIDQLGQGIQHIACRVVDLVDFIQHGNLVREVTGRGFRFLRIPTSYYGRLTLADLERDAKLSRGAAAAVDAALQQANLVSASGAVNLDITDKHITNALGSVDAKHTAEVLEKLSDTCTVVKRARYCNLHKLLRDHISEESYLKIVRNQILVDIQGQDILYQIFTANVMQRTEGDEAPFFEFIQRVCSEQNDACGKPLPVRPGCGGFGIRNFLTLFLSIEVSKAMLQLEQAQAAGDVKAAAFAQKVIDIFTEQMEESNPILTSISDAMTAEADALIAAEGAADPEKKAVHLAAAKRFEAIKAEGQEKLMVCGEKHKAAMRALRQQQPQ